MIYQKPSINAYLMCKRLEWSGYFWNLNGLLNEVLVGKLNGKRPRSRYRQHWPNRIKNDLIKCIQEIEIENRNSGIENSVDTDKWRNVVEAAKVFQLP